MKVIKTKILLISMAFATIFPTFAKVTIIYNVKGQTINQHELTKFNTIAFEYGKILKISSTDDLSELYPDAELIDGEGKSMLPGLHDSHTSMMQSAFMDTQVDLRETKSVEQALNKIQKFIDNHPENEWIRGFGWDHKKWKDPLLPTHQDLDKLDTNKPVWLKAKNRQMGWANTTAMKIARAAKYKKFNSAGGRIIFNKNGSHTGIYMGSALNIIDPHIPDVTPDRKYSLLKARLKDMASFGITGIDDAGVDYRTSIMYTALANNRRLPIRVNAVISSSEKKINAILTKGPYHEENQFLHIHTLKYYVDGHLDTYTAAMSAPYSDKKNEKGRIKQSLPFLKENIYEKAESGWQVSLHAVGDMANNIALNILSNTSARSTALRHRIEGSAILKTKDISKFKKENLIVSIQPNAAIENIAFYKKRIGKKRLENTHTWQSLIKNGATLISGSGFPQHSPNPFYGIHAAVTRQKSSSRPSSSWKPKEKMTVIQALASYTINPAYANRQEQSLGSLEAGKWADFILVNQDIFNIEPNEIWKTTVLQTWVAGNKIYDFKEAQEKNKIFSSSLEKN